MSEHKRLHTCCHKWKELNAKWEERSKQSFNVANQVVNHQLRIAHISSLDSTAQEASLDEINERLFVANEKRCLLMETFDYLKDIYRSMEQLCVNFQAVRDLCVDKGQEKVTICNTWSGNQFYETSLSLLEGYRKEIELKECLIYELFRTTERELLLFFLSAWLHQPYLTSEHKLLLDSIYLEAKLHS